MINLSGDEDGFQYAEIDEILDHKKENGKIKLLVSIKGKNIKKWFKYELLDCDELLLRYIKKDLLIKKQVSNERYATQTDSVIKANDLDNSLQQSLDDDFDLLKGKFTVHDLLIDNTNSQIQANENRLENILIESIISIDKAKNKAVVQLGVTKIQIDVDLKVLIEQYPSLVCDFYLSKK